MRSYNRSDVADIKDSKTRNALIRMDEYLIDASKQLTLLAGGAQGASVSGAITPGATDTGSSMVGMGFVTLATDNTLLNERVVTAGAGITLTDGGAKGNLTISQDGAYADRLISATTTVGDSLTLTSDGTDLTLTPSRSGSDLIFNTPSGLPVMRLYEKDLVAGVYGIHTPGHMSIGSDLNDIGAAPSTSQLLTVCQKSSEVSAAFPGSGGIITGLWFEPEYDEDMVGVDRIGMLDQVTLVTGFDPDSTGVTAPFLTPLKVITRGDVGGAALVGRVLELANIKSSVSVSLPALSPAWPDVIGLDIPAVTVTGGTVPTRTYGIRVGTAGNGTTGFSASFAGQVQVTLTSKLGFGRAQGTQPTIYIKAKTSAGSTLVFGTASVDEWELSSTAFYPSTSGGSGVGQNGNGIGDLWFLDTSAAFEVRALCTSSTALTADRTLTLDMANGSRTLKLTGNVTGDQDVSSTATPTHAGLKLKDTAAAYYLTLNTTNTSIGADRSLTVNVGNVSRTLDFTGSTAATVTLSDWFDQNVKTTGNPTFASVTLADGGNVPVGTTTGTKIGTATSQKLGFFNATPVVQRTDVGPLEDSTGGTADGELVDVGVLFNQGNINDNFKECSVKINAIRTVLRDMGLMA